VGDLLILLIGMKPSVANSGSVTAPEGWTLITSLVGAGGYGVTLAADTGNTNVFAYYKLAEGNETGSVLVRLTNNNSAWAQMYRLTNATQNWLVAGATGSDVTLGAAVSITMSADPGVTVGDFILGAMVIPTDVTTPGQFSLEAFTQTGVTFGAVTEISEPDSATGNDIGGFVVRSSVTAGTGSAAPVMTATAGGTTTNVRGPGIFIRVRATGAITYQAPGALNYVANLASVCPAHPASVASGNLLVTLIGMKPSAANSGSVTTPSGWTAVSGGSLTGAGGYGATLGGDTGNTNVFSFYRVARGNEATERCFALTTSNVAWAQMYRFSSTTQTWQLAGTTGSDITAGSVSITMSANPGVTVGDHILGAMVIPTDVQTPTQFSVEAFAQTGVTFGAVTEVSEPDTTTGNDLGGFVVRSTATAGVGSAAPVMTATAGGTTTNVRGPGVFIRIRDESAFSQAAFRFYDDGTEAGSTAIAAQDTNISRDVAAGNSNLQLRLRAQEINALSGAAVDDFQLQYSKNAGAYTNVTGASANVRGFNSASLSDGGATTNRLGAGTGSFVAGVIAEDGLADNHQITTSNYTEYLFSLTLVSADLANADTLDFRLLRNGVTIAAYSVAPRITITKVTVSSFNGCESATCTPVAAPLTYAALYTKRAGTAFTLYGVALKVDGTLESGFAGSVTADLLANASTGVALDGNGCPVSQDATVALGSAAFAAGRATIAGINVASAYRDVRMRFSCTALVCGSAITKCSSDNFAIRPSAFTVSSSANADAMGGDVDLTPAVKAGATFTLTATALANYNLAPAIDSTKLAAHAGAIQNGTLAAVTVGFGTAAPGTGVATGDFRYSEVGYFNFAANGVYDQSFTSVDQKVLPTPSDCTDDFSNSLDVNGKYGCKFGNTLATSYFGRFVPDRFGLTTGILIDRAGINTGASETCSSSFTYMGEDVKTTFTLAAQNSSSVTTQNYTGGHAKFGLTTWADFGFTGSAGTLVAGGAAPSGSWGSTVGTYGTAAVTATHRITRPGVATAPYTSFTVSALPSYTDGAATITMAASSVVHAGNSEQRYGRLRILGAYGSELLPLRVPIRAEYLNGTAWTLNAADNCTSLAANAFGLSGGIAANTSASAVPPLTGGKGTLTLAKPSPVAVGSVDVAANLGATGVTADVSCNASHPATTAANMPWLQFAWCNTKLDPNARVKFGAAKAPYIYLRERY
jgi:hypothetical protein